MEIDGCAWTDLPLEAGEVWRAPARRTDYAERLWARAIPGDAPDLGNQLQSFTTSRDIANSWRSGVNLLLRIEKPRHGAYIEPISMNPGELEVLFPPGMRYRVVRRTEETINGERVRVVTLEVID